MYLINITLRLQRVVADYAGPSIPVDVDIATDHFGEHSFTIDLNILTYPQLDVLEDWVLDRPRDESDLDRFGESLAAISRIGRSLFDATLGQWGQWPNIKAAAIQSGDVVRIRIRTPSALIAAQPWEYLESPDDSYIALLPWVRISRNPQRTAPISSTLTRAPLRILLCGSTPVDLPGIDVSGELNGLVERLAGFGGAVESYVVTMQPSACTFELFSVAVHDNGPWDIVHFSGHGGFHPSLGGLLAFCTPSGTTDSRPASQIAATLTAHPSLRLVILNACRGAMGAGRQLTESVGGALVQGGVPACVSMQFEISDFAAIQFGASLHMGIVQHGDIDRAVMESRRAINEISLLPHSILGSATRSSEWGSPVLHQDLIDTRIFHPVSNVENVQSGSPVLISRATSAPELARLSGSLTEVSRMRWRLAYSTGLELKPALDRVETALMATADVRKLDRSENVINALAGGLFPGVFSATQAFEILAEDHRGGAAITIDCFPKQRVLVDWGANKLAAQRLALYLGIDV